MRTTQCVRDNGRRKRNPRGAPWGFAAAVAYPFGQRLVATLFHRGPSWADLFVTQAAIVLPFALFCVENFGAVRQKVSGLTAEFDLHKQFYTEDQKAQSTKLQEFLSRPRSVADALSPEQLDRLMRLAEQVDPMAKKYSPGNDEIQVEPRSTSPAGSSAWVNATGPPSGELTP